MLTFGDSTTDNTIYSLDSVSTIEVFYLYCKLHWTETWKSVWGNSIVHETELTWAYIIWSALLWSGVDKLLKKCDVAMTFSVI